MFSDGGLKSTTTQSTNFFGAPQLTTYTTSVSQSQMIGHQVGQATAGLLQLYMIQQAKRKAKDEEQRAYLERTSSFKTETLVYSPTAPLLAPGWEIRHTPEARVYYLNHQTKTSAWEVPPEAVLTADCPEFKRTQFVFTKNLAIADQYIRDNRYEDACAAISTTMAENPNYARLYYMRAICSMSCGKYDNAFGDLCTTIRLNTTEKKMSLYFRARLYRAMGRYDLATADYTLAYRSKPHNEPSDFSLLLHRGHCNAKLRNVPLAIADFTEAIQVWRQSVLRERERETETECVERYNTFEVERC
jgi:Tfp pilus assembly protein PilF